MLSGAACPPRGYHSNEPEITHSEDSYSSPFPYQHQPPVAGPHQKQHHSQKTVAKAGEWSRASRKQTRPRQQIWEEQPVEGGGTHVCQMFTGQDRANCKHQNRAYAMRCQALRSADWTHSTACSL